MEIITSRNNQMITDALKLRQKKYRDERSMFIFEGKKLLIDAVAVNIRLYRVFYTERNKDFISSLHLNCDTFEVSDPVYDKLTEENSPSGIFCVAMYLDRIRFLRTINKDDGIYRTFAAVSVRDPGNLGTLIRTANAFSVGTLILSSDCADVYNTKTVRASMGALFRQDIVIYEDADISSLPISLKSIGYTVYAAALHTDALSLSELKVDATTCFIVGNEGHGLPDKLISNCSGCVYIPMNEGAESLNVASASSVLMWECFKSTI